MELPARKFCNIQKSSRIMKLCLDAICATPVNPLRVEALESPLELSRHHMTEWFTIKSSNKISYQKNVGIKYIWLAKNSRKLYVKLSEKP